MNWLINLIILFIGIFIGRIIAAIYMFNNVERIYLTKKQIMERFIEKNTPIIGLFKWTGKLFISPEKTLFLPDENVIWQIPNREIFRNRPGNKPSEDYQKWFSEYILFRHLSIAEAYRQAVHDYPDKIGFHYEDQNSFSSAMQRLKRKYNQTH